MAKKIDNLKTNKDLPLAIIKQMITLSTSGFGLVAALAWNEAVKEFVEAYIKPYLPAGSKFISLLVYATIVTALAVLITLQLTKIQQRLESLQYKFKPKKP